RRPFVAAQQESKVDRAELQRAGWLPENIFGKPWMHLCNQVSGGNRRVAFRPHLRFSGGWSAKNENAADVSVVAQGTGSDRFAGFNQCTHVFHVRLMKLFCLSRFGGTPLWPFLENGHVKL